VVDSGNNKTVYRKGAFLYGGNSKFHMSKSDLPVMKYLTGTCLELVFILF